MKIVNSSISDIPVVHVVYTDKLNIKKIKSYVNISFLYVMVTSLLCIKLFLHKKVGYRLVLNNLPLLKKKKTNIFII